MSGLSPTQIQQIQQAVQGVSGGSGNTANAQIMQQLSADGWDPSQVQALSTDGIAGNNNFTGAVPSGTWASQIQSALAQNAQATNPANTPNPAASANQNAVAAGGTATSEQQLQNLFQPTYMQTPASGTATQYTGSVDPTATIQSIQTGLAPQYAQANANLNNQLAASGIEGGSAIDAQQQLQSAETGTTASAIQAAIQSAQGLNQQAGLANTASQNAFNDQNLQNLYNTNQYNTTAANTAQSNYAQDLLGQTNTDANSFNTLNNSSFGATNGLASQGLTANNNLAQNIAGNYQVQTGAAQGAGAVAGQVGSAYQNYLNSQNPGTSTAQAQLPTSPYQVS